MESEMLQKLNAPILYVIVGAAVLAVGAMCVVFLIKSWRAGLAIGMDRKVLKKAIISSATFSVLPAFSILLGVIALSGSLGIPLPWLRLSVIGNLQYEINVAQIAATGIGLSGLRITEMTPQAFVTIALVMTCGILGEVATSWSTSSRTSSTCSTTLSTAPRHWAARIWWIGGWWSARRCSSSSTRTGAPCWTTTAPRTRGSSSRSRRRRCAG